MSKDQSTKKPLGVLAGALAPALDLVGPTAHDDIRRAISRYGAEAVKAAVKELTKAKRGRPREPDFPELREVFRADAREWLSGGDPFAARSNYAIAKEFAKRNPGHSEVSTYKRIERKLSRGIYDRRWWTITTAENLSRDGWPYQAHLRALKAEAQLKDKMSAQVGGAGLSRALSTIADYVAREGKEPDPSMSFAEIAAAVSQGSLAALSTPRRPGGMFGLAKTTGSPTGGLASILADAVRSAERRD